MIRELYDPRREALEKDLSRCEDVKAAADCIGAALEKLRIDTRAQADTPSLRHETDRLFEAARQAALLMMSVTEADISVSPTPLDKRGKFMAALPWVNTGIGLFLALWMILLSQTGAAAVALVSAAAGLLQAWHKETAQPSDVHATTKVNVYELMRMTDRLTSAMDDALLQAGQDQAALPGTGTAAITGDILSPVQMLMEAVYTQDGDYALKAAPQLAEALQSQGIQLVNYSTEHRDWFEIFPGTEDGLTIRPAMVKEGRLLARGQATEQM